MATLELAGCGIPFLAVAPLTGGLTVRHGTAWRAIAVASVGCGALAIVVQRWAQRRTAPAGRLHPGRRTVFAALAGWLLAGDRIAPVGWLGSR